MRGGELNGKGHKTGEMGIKIYQPQKLTKRPFMSDSPKQRKIGLGQIWQEEMRFCLKKKKSEGSSFVADADDDADADADADADDDDCERWFLRRGIGNSRQMWTATWQAPTTARTTIVIFNIFSLDFLKI